MKKELFKRLGLVLMAFTLVFSLAACGQGKDGANGEPVNDGGEVATEPVTSEEPIELMVSAAASLTDALNEVKADFEAIHPHVTVTLNLASSGKLVQQIEQGAPVDLFISANQSFMDQLMEKELIDNDTRVDVVGNDLVLITQADREDLPTELAQLADERFGAIAIGEVDSVPAGKYAMQTLSEVGIWEEIQDRLIFTSNVRQVLTYVESGNVDFGAVFASDAKISDQVKVVTNMDAGHDPILYPAAVLTASEHPEMAAAFIQYLQEDGAATLEAYGFRIP